MKVLDNLHAFIWQDMTANNCNTYLVNGSRRILIDPGHRDFLDNVRLQLAKLNLQPSDIDVVIITHGHPDHMEGVELFSPPTIVAMGKETKELFKGMSLIYPNSQKLIDYEPDILLQEGPVKFGDETFQVIQTPGHSPGSICLYWQEQKVLFTGDVVFNGGIGRTDLPGGNGQRLKNSIERLARLEVNYLLPGHGDIICDRQWVKSNFEMIENDWFDYLA